MIMLVESYSNSHSKWQPTQVRVYAHMSSKNYEESEPNGLD